MAEDLRNDDPSAGWMNEARDALIIECETEAESCLYTSTSFHIWLRTLKAIRAVLWGIGAFAGAVSAARILGDPQGSPIVTAALALTGILAPALTRALKLDTAIDDYAKAAGVFKNLQGEFRRAANVWSKKPFPEFEKEARKTITAMDDARKPSLTPPEWSFKCAQKKVKRGDYDKD